LADESCDFAVVRGLREAGHDVIAVVEISRGVDDSEVIDLAKSDRRILITEDKDFGQLVYAAARQSSGVVFIRFPANARSSLIAAILNLVAARGDALYGLFVVVEPGRIRLGRSA
jgi:predicted nuclease of predicted toxin-antitoxin system